jgi:hypothetical protein
MDASDNTRTKKAKVIYIDTYNKFLTNNPEGDCAKMSTCSYTTSSCFIHYNSYEERRDFLVGQAVCGQN